MDILRTMLIERKIQKYVEWLLHPDVLTYGCHSLVGRTAQTIRATLANRMRWFIADGSLLSNDALASSAVRFHETSEHGRKHYRVDLPDELVESAKQE